MRVRKHIKVLGRPKLSFRKEKVSVSIDKDSFSILNHIPGYRSRFINFLIRKYGRVEMDNFIKGAA